MIEIKQDNKEFELIIDNQSIIKTDNFNRILRELRDSYEKFVSKKKWV